MSFQGNWGGKWSGDWLGAQEASATEVGARSLLAFWAGGAGSVTPTGGSQGYTGMLGFWFGGGGTSGGIAPTAAKDWIVTQARRRGRR